MEICTTEESYCKKRPVYAVGEYTGSLIKLLFKERPTFYFVRRSGGEVL